MKLLCALCAATTLALSGPALAYTDSLGANIPPVVPIDGSTGTPMGTSANPQHVTGSFSATVAGFSPTPSYAQLTVGSSSSRVALPTGTTIVVYNTGSAPAYVTLGNSSVAATTSDDLIQAGGWMAFVVGSATYIAAIETSGATGLNISGGTGLPTGAGAGGGSSGGGGGGGSGNTPQTTATASMSISTATTTQVIAHSSGDYTYITSWDVIAGGSGNFQLEYGTQSSTPCDTSPTPLTGNYNLAAQVGLTRGSGYGTVLVVPVGKDVCAVTSAAVQYSGSISYTQSSTALTAFGGGGGSDASVGTNGSTAPASSTQMGLVDGSGNLQPVSSTNPVPTTGSFSATISGFQPSASGARMTPLSVTTSDSSQTLPTGAVVVVSNVGTTNPMYCNANGVTATTSDQLIPPDSWFGFTIPSGVTALHCIATGASTTANGMGGSGIPTGSGGGGSGGGGGGGAVTIASSAVAAGAYSAGAFVSGSFLSGAFADGAIATLGTEADTAWSSGSGTVIAILKKIVANQEVTAAGTSASSAQAVQGVTGGIAIPVIGAITANAGTGTFAISASALPLPTGAATSANQTGGGAKTQIVDSSDANLFTSGNPGQVTGSFSATIAGFAPTPGYAALSVSSSSSRVALPTGTVDIVYNQGTAPACVLLGSSSVTATSSGALCTNDDVIQPGSWMSFTVGSAVDLAAIDTSAGTTNLVISGGAGIPTGSGGGSSGSSSGNADQTLTATGTISAADSLYTASTWTKGQTVLTWAGGSPTSGSNQEFPAFSGASTGVLICYGTFSATLEFDTLMDAASPAHYVKQTITELIGGASPDKSGSFTGPIIGKFDLTGAIGGRIRATAYTSGSPTCTLRISGNQSDVKVSNLLPRGASVPINISTATTTQLVALAAGQSIYISAWDVIASGTGSFTLEYGTGSNCGSGTTALTGAYGLAAQAGINKGDGIAAVLTIPAGNALCALTSAAVQMSGSVTYAQY